MKDLKHLIYFENLLQQANNELIAEAKKKGGIAVAYTCENVPEPLLNLGKRARNTVSAFCRRPGSPTICRAMITRRDIAPSFVG